MKTMGQKIYELRAKTPLTQPELAAVAEVNPATISRIEGGQNTDVRTAFLIARALGVPLDYLADETMDAPPTSAHDDIAALVSQVLTRAGLAGELTDEETQLLAGYRRLGPAGRARLMGFVDGLLAAVSGPAEGQERPQTPVEQRSAKAKAAGVMSDLDRSGAGATAARRPGRKAE